MIPNDDPRSYDACIIRDKWASATRTALKMLRLNPETIGPDENEGSKWSPVEVTVQTWEREQITSGRGNKPDVGEGTRKTWRKQTVQTWERDQIPCGSLKNLNCTVCCTSYASVICIKKWTKPTLKE